MTYYNEAGSIQLIKDILEGGVEILSRAGNCKALFGGRGIIEVSWCE